MKKLVRGIVEFKKDLTQERIDLFAKIALGQKPDALFIACSDSRVVPNLFASTEPGDLFVLRNIGNLVPSADKEEDSVAAALEFAILSLKVKDIIVCGHTECGAMQGILSGVDAPHLKNWLEHGKEAAKKLEAGETLDSSLSKHNQLSQLNVLQQMEHIRSYPITKDVRIHGWWFDIANADVYCYEQDRFILIDETEAELILARLS